MQDEDLCRLDSHDRRRVRCPVEDGQLPEELARAEDRDDRGLGALVGWQDHLDGSARHDEQGVAGVALVKDRLGLAKAPEAERGGERINRGLVGVAEQAARAERVLRNGSATYCHLALCHSTWLSANPSAQTRPRRALP